jgi:replicative DNA helicase
VALKEQMPVVIFSLEMGASQLAMRMAASVGRIDSQAMRTGRLDDEQWGRLAESADQISKAPAIIDEAPSLSIAEMRARARRYARELGAQMGLVVVDYIQLMPGADGSGENRATQLGEVSRGLKAMAKELQCPVLALSQLNRAVEARANKRPMMSDLRDSGALEQDADVIAFVYRDEYYDPHSAARGTAELIVAKQRNGPTCTVDLGFAAELTRFQNLPDDYVRPR